MSADLMDALTDAMSAASIDDPSAGGEVESAVNDLIRGVYDAFGSGQLMRALALVRRLHDAFDCGLPAQQQSKKSIAVLTAVGWDITESLLSLLQQFTAIGAGGASDSVSASLLASMDTLRGWVRAVLFRICELCTPREVLLTLITHAQYLQTITVENWQIVPDWFQCLKRLCSQPAPTATRRTALFRQIVPVVARLLAILQLRIVPITDPDKPDAADAAEDDSGDGDSGDAKQSVAKRQSSGANSAPAAAAARRLTPAFLSIYTHCLNAITEWVQPFVATGSNTADRDLLLAVVFDLIKHRMLFAPHALTLIPKPTAAAATAAAESKSSTAPAATAAAAGAPTAAPIASTATATATTTATTTTAAPPSSGGGTFRPNAPPTPTSGALLAAYFPKEAEELSRLIIRSGVDASHVFRYAVERVRLERALQTESVERDWAKHTARAKAAADKLAAVNAAHKSESGSGDSKAPAATASAGPKSKSKAHAVSADGDGDGDDGGDDAMNADVDADADADGDADGDEDEEAVQSETAVLYDALPKWSMDGIAAFLAFVLRRAATAATPPTAAAATGATASTTAAPAGDSKSGDSKAAAATAVSNAVALSGSELFLQSIPFMMALLASQQHAAAMTVGRQLVDDALTLRTATEATLKHSLDITRTAGAAATVAAPAPAPPQYSLTELKDPNVGLWGLIQTLCSFMVFHPDTQQRSFGYRTMSRVLTGVLDPHARWHVLDSAVHTCPYASVVSVLIVLIKDEVRKAWPSAAAASAANATASAAANEAVNPFVSPAVPALLAEALDRCTLTPHALLERLDIAINVLSAYRFLWLTSNSAAATNRSTASGDSKSDAKGGGASNSDDRLGLIASRAAWRDRHLRSVSDSVSHALRLFATHNREKLSPTDFAAMGGSTTTAAAAGSVPVNATKPAAAAVDTSTALPVPAAGSATLSPASILRVPDSAPAATAVGAAVSDAKSGGKAKAKKQARFAVADDSKSATAATATTADGSDETDGESISATGAGAGAAAALDESADAWSVDSVTLNFLRARLALVEQQRVWIEQLLVGESGGSAPVSASVGAARSTTDGVGSPPVSSTSSQ